MPKLGVWQIRKMAPIKLDAALVDLEEHLEDWIEKDPGLLQEGLTVVGRQMTVDGGRLDLLAVDTQGRWIVIEIKAGQVRRDTVAQAIDYASSVAMMPWTALSSKANSYLQQSGAAGGQSLQELGVHEDEAPRDVWMTVVGTGREPGLERIVNYLADVYDVPITIISYEVFSIASGEQIMVRELSEVEGAEKEPRSSSHYDLTIEQMRAMAAENGIGEAFDVLLDTANRHGFYPRTYKRSVMYTPPQNKTRMLYTVRTDADSEGNLQLYVWAEAFSEFYDVTAEKAANLLGDKGWHSMRAVDAREFAAQLDKLLGAEEQSS